MYTEWEKGALHKSYVRLKYALLWSDIRSEGSIAIVKKLDFDFL